ncbi:hypothetical protein GALMADRAFT_1349063 [Galerina marginata CBS 339.88]|uniref:Uncharacterized protein n=1 Tax=Galerina marginata (strain CBS 339.88) TaxID=685588 RepID=A0A067TVM9_GALM3|nr:hypothetical protein GALMADRAFT_1349063 [Galerina marginata CBS 339.88]
MMSPESFQPLQLKGEIMDLEFTIDTDHRKRRRNRTTQSCLNCHTSKRKTGLCVYEIDDPALRDDPSLDESTRLRNRIAELESLVRELRGKPHPRWAETSFRDGDPNEKWHSRATKCVPLQKRSSGQQTTQVGQQPEDLLRNGRAVHSLLSPIKTEPATEANAHLYRFSPSPQPSMRYHTFQADVRPGSDSSSSFDDPRSAGGYNATNGNGVAYHGNNSTNGHYNNGSGNQGSAPSPYPENGGGGTANYPLSSSDDGNNAYADQYSVNSASPQSHFACPCRTNPALGIAYINLSQTLQNSLGSLRQYAHHPTNTQCTLFRRIVELNNSLHGNDSPGLVATSYDSGPASDSEIMTPLSASSGHASFHTGSPGVSPQEWNHMAAAGFNPYFPAPDHHGVYSVNHVMS